MKNLNFSLPAILLLASTSLFSQNTNNLQQPTSVNTDGSVPDASAMLDVQSNTQGLLVPRMTTGQREAIASPAVGLLVFDMDTNTFWFSDNGFWTELVVTAPSEMGSNTTALPIPDCDPTGVTSTITLSQSGLVGAGSQFVVCLDITHTRDADMDISLESPDGTVIDLSSDNGNNNPNFTGTCFTTQAVNPITGGTAPFTGDWIPEEPFSNFIGDAIAGDWKLNVVDDKCNFTGQLDSWSIQILRDGGNFNSIVDNDNDTKVRVEASLDEDIVRIVAGGNERLRIFPDSSVFTDNLWVDGIFVSGNGNTATGNVSFVGGGGGNIASADSSFVGGGRGNTASGSYSFVGGGRSNDASGSSSFVGGGFFNHAPGTSSFVGGGENNYASGDRSFIGGGATNDASGDRSFIGGGVANDASGDRSFVGGGTINDASGTSSFVGGGEYNTASGDRSFVGGGLFLTAKSYAEAVFGTYNTNYTPISVSSLESADRLFVIGNGTSSANRSNAVTVMKNGDVGIGTDNPALNLHIVGGTDADPTGGGYIQTGNTSGQNIAIDENEIMARSNGGTSQLFLNHSGGNVKIGNSSSNIGIGRNPITNNLEVEGTASKSTAGDWLANSDARLKTNIRPLDSEVILQKMLALQGITYEWNDDVTGSQRPEGTMYGFTAQNIQEVFPELVSEDNLGFLQTAYGTYDAMTVEAMRALYDKDLKQHAEIESLRAENARLSNRLTTTEAGLARLEAAVFGAAEKPAQAGGED